MEFNISEEDKNRIKEQNIQALEIQLYTELLFIGLDPEEFEFSFLDDKDSAEDMVKYKITKDIVERIIALRAL